MKNIFSLILIIYMFSGFSMKAFGQNPSNDAEFISIVKEYTLKSDGSMEYHYYHKLKLLTYFSIHRLYGETFIVYNPKQQKLKVNLCRTTMANGKVIEAPQNAFNEVLPGFAQNAPDFNHLREMVVTHTGLELNAVVEIDYTITTTGNYFPALMGVETISEYSPVSEYILKVNVPPGKKLNYKVFNIRTAPEINEKDGSTEYRFKFSNVTGQSHESFQPKYGTHLPRVSFSTADWKSMYTFLVNQPGFDYKILPDMQESVQKATSEAKDDLQKVFKLQELVVNTINTMNVPPMHYGFKPRNCNDSWNSNYATELEKCLLLTSLLQGAKINAEPIAIIPTSQFDENTGNLLQAEQFLVRVNPRETKQLFISVTRINDQNLLYDLQGMTIIPLIRQKPMVPEVVQPVDNLLVFSADLIVSDTLSVSGIASLMTCYKPNPYYESLRDINKSKSWLGGLIGQQDVKEAKNLNNEQERSTYEYVIEKKAKLRPYGDYLTIDLPLVTKGIKSWGMNILNKNRSSDLQIPFTIEEKNTFTIQLPAKAKLLNTVTEKRGTYEWGTFNISIKQEGNKVLVERSARVQKSIIDQGKFPEFKSFIDAWNTEKYNKLYLKF